MTFISNTTDALARVKDSTNAMDKAAKTVKYSLIAARGGLQLSNIAVDSAIDQLSNFNSLVGGLNIVGRLKNLADETWWRNSTTQKKIGEIFLTGAHAVEFTRFLGRLSIVPLGAMSEVLLGVKNALLLPASGFNVWDAVLQMKKADQIVKKWHSKERWLVRERAIQQGPTEVSKVIEAKIAKLQMEIESLNNKKGVDDSLTAEDASRLNTKRLRLARWEIYQGDYEEGDHSPQFTNDVKVMSKKVKDVKKMQGRIKTKQWVSIANNVMKFALGIAFFVGLSFTIFTSFALSALPAFVVGCAALWAATNFLALFKEVYWQINQMKEPQSMNIENLPLVSLRA